MKGIEHDYKNPLLENKTPHEIAEQSYLILSKIDNKETLTEDEMHFFDKEIGRVHERKERCYGEWDTAVHIIKELYRKESFGPQYYEIMYRHIRRTYSPSTDEYQYVKAVYPVEFQTVVTYREWKFKD